MNAIEQGDQVAEMFMANEPLKQRAILWRRGRWPALTLQRCLWRMSH